MFDTFPVMTIFAGPNGAGKSTMRELIKDEQDLGIEVDADAIAREQHLTDIQAGREVIRKVDACISEGMSFSLETTLSGKLILDQIHLAKERGFQIRLLFVSLDSPIEHITRVEQRAARGGHFIPSKDIERRYYRSHENLKKAIPLVDYVDIFSNTSKCEIAVRIENGKIVERSLYTPTWVKDAVSHLKEKSVGSTQMYVGTSQRRRVCSSRCKTSKAPVSKCRCVCGGKNHGIRK